MTRPDLADLQASLRAACGETRRKLDDYELGTLSRVFDVDANGRPAFVVWQCRLPSGDGGERNYEMLRLPWDGFLQNETMLKELSISFDCEISRQDASKKGEAATYTVRLKKAGRSGVQQHRFEMKLDADNDYLAETTMDGVPLELFLEQPEVLAEFERLPFTRDLWFGLKGIKPALLELLAIFLGLAAPIVLWLSYTGQI